MTATPAPGDLKARQLKAVCDAMHACYMDHADNRLTTTLLKDMAKAALSALPAAGGSDCRHDGALLVVSGHCYCKTCGALTTPQPSAVSFDPASIGPFTAAAALMQATDAAVGAQGDGDDYAARIYIRDWCPDHVKDYIARLAAPAAGKGVDDVVWRIDNEAEQFVSETGMPYLRYLRDLLTGEKAALTRQPVAGDGNTEVRLFDGQWVSIVNHANCWRDYTKEEAISEAVRMTEAAIAENIALGRLPKRRAAPAATPTDGEAASA